MFGNSTLWIFTRVITDSFSPFAPIVILRKMINTQRLFCIFGTVVQKKEISGRISQHFKYFKSQEVPNFAYDAETNEYLDQPSFKQTQEDYIDFSLEMIDNGDDKICVEFQLEKEKVINITCAMYVPMPEMSTIMIAGAGHSVYIRTVSLKQINRVDNFKTGIQITEKKPYDCCCKLF